MSTVLIGLMGCKQDSDPLSSLKEITKFGVVLADPPNENTEPAPTFGEITKATRTILVNLPAGTSVTRLIPSITISDQAKVSPAPGTAVDFSSPQTFTVTAEDSTTQDYLVTVKVAASPSDKAITSFALKAKDGTNVGTSLSPAIDVIAINYNVPWNTDVKWLVPTIGISGASVSPTSAVAQDFSEPVRYTVTAQNGTTKEYLVTVTVEPAADAKAITSFALTTKDGTSVGNVNNTTTPVPTTIVINAPWGTDVKWLVPAIAISDDASVSPASAVAQDFSEPVRYVVTAQDGSTREYLVTVRVAQGAAAKMITGFALKAKDGTDVGAGTRTALKDDTITVLVPAGTDVKWLVPTITISDDASVSPASAVAQDFSEPVRYIVTAQDGSTSEYLVTVTEASLKSLAIAGPTKTAYKVGEALALAGFSVTATYSDNVTEIVGDYELSEFENSTVGTKTITATVSRNGVTLKKDFTVSVTGEALALKIELVNDQIVSLFGLTSAEATNTTTGIQLSVKGSRREVVISLTGYSTTSGDPSSDVKWAVDGGNWTNGSGEANVVTIKAANYTLGRHWVEFTGTKDDGSGNKIPYSKTFYFTVDIN
jgi:hypothetical protein